MGTGRVRPRLAALAGLLVIAHLLGVRCIPRLLVFALMQSLAIGSANKKTDVQGPMVRIGPNEILCFDPNEVRRILSLKGGHAKDKRYKVGQISPPEENTITVIEPEARRQRKKMLLLAVSTRTVSVGIEADGPSMPARAPPTLSRASTPD